MEKLQVAQRDAQYWVIHGRRFTPDLESQYKEMTLGRHAERMCYFLSCMAAFFISFVVFDFFDSADHFYTVALFRTATACMALIYVQIMRTAFFVRFVQSRHNRAFIFTAVVMLSLSMATTYIANVKQNFSTPLSLVLVLVACFGFYPLSWYLLAPILCIPVIVWQVYLWSIGTLQLTLQLNSAFTLSAVVLMGIIYSIKTELIQREDFFASNFALTERARSRTLRIQYSALMSACVPDFMTLRSVHTITGYAAATVCVLRMHNLASFINSQTKACDVSSIVDMLLGSLVDKICTKFGIRRIHMHGEDIVFLGNLPGLSQTGHGTMFCATSKLISSIQQKILKEIGTRIFCTAGIGSGDIDITFVGTTNRSISLAGTSVKHAYAALDALKSYRDPSSGRREADEARAALAALPLSPKAAHTASVKRIKDTWNVDDTAAAAAVDNDEDHNYDFGGYAAGVGYPLQDSDFLDNLLSGNVNNESINESGAPLCNDAIVVDHGVREAIVERFARNVAVACDNIKSIGRVEGSATAHAFGTNELYCIEQHVGIVLHMAKKMATKTRRHTGMDAIAVLSNQSSDEGTYDLSAHMRKTAVLKNARAVHKERREVTQIHGDATERARRKRVRQRGSLVDFSDIGTLDLEVLGANMDGHRKQALLCEQLINPPAVVSVSTNHGALLQRISEKQVSTSQRSWSTLFAPLFSLTHRIPISHQRERELSLQPSQRAAFRQHYRERFTRISTLWACIGQVLLLLFAIFDVVTLSNTTHHVWYVQFGGACALGICFLAAYLKLNIGRTKLFLAWLWFFYAFVFVFYMMWPSANKRFSGSRLMVALVYITLFTRVTLVDFLQSVSWLPLVSFGAVGLTNHFTGGSLEWFQLDTTHDYAYYLFVGTLIACTVSFINYRYDARRFLESMLLEEVHAVLVKKQNETQNSLNDFFPFEIARAMVRFSDRANDALFFDDSAVLALKITFKDQVEEQKIVALLDEHLISSEFEKLTYCERIYTIRFNEMQIRSEPRRRAAHRAAKKLLCKLTLEVETTVNRPHSCLIQSSGLAFGNVFLCACGTTSINLVAMGSAVQTAVALCRQNTGPEIACVNRLSDMIALH